MTETHATTPPTAPLFPPGRYGRRRERGSGRRGVVWVTALAVILVAVALSIRLYQQYGDPTYEPEVIGYTDITDTQIVIRFRVRLPEGAEARCSVRARAHDGRVVGRAEVPVPAGTSEVSHRLGTTSRAFIGEVLRCRAAG